MHVDEQQILNVSRELWSSQLGLSLQPVVDGSSLNDDPTVSSRIKVSGEWKGAIVIECSESVARHAAAMLFEVDGNTTDQDEIHDALNELADMIGRKMRAVLPETTKLSRATTVGSNDEHHDQVGISHTELSCEGRPVRISVFEAEAEPVTAA